MSESVSSDPVGHSADLRTRIAAVVAAHRDQCGDCSCGWESWETSWDMHLADAVIRELGLEPQAHYDPDCPFFRYVTDWIDPVTGLKVDLP